MSWRRVAVYYVLFGIAVLCYWRTSPSPPAVEVPRSDELALVDLSLDRVVELRLVRAEAGVRCRLEAGRWRLVEPAGAWVPADLIASLVTTLVEIRAAELIASERRENDSFGLGPQALRIELYEDKHELPTTIVLGSRNPTETAVYARVEGSPRVLLVGRVLEYYAERVFEEARRRRTSG